MNRDYISTSEAAEIMGISRVAVFKKIKKGEIKAEKVGRNYVIDKGSLGSIFQELQPTQKQRVKEAVSKAVAQYGPALKKLGRE